MLLSRRAIAVTVVAKIVKETVAIGVARTPAVAATANCIVILNVVAVFVSIGIAVRIAIVTTAILVATVAFTVRRRAAAIITAVLATLRTITVFSLGSIVIGVGVIHHSEGRCQTRASLIAVETIHLLVPDLFAICGGGHTAFTGYIAARGFPFRNAIVFCAGAIQSRTIISLHYNDCIF